MAINLSEAARHETVFDAEHQRVGDVYAKALLAVGSQRGNVDRLLGELDSLVQDVLPKLDQLRAILESPRVPVEAKLGIVDKMLRGRASQEFINFVKVVVRKGRIAALAAIHKAAHTMFNEAAGRLEATLITAAPVDGATQERVAARLTEQLGQQVSLASRVDPRILGGMVVRVGDTVYDASLANQLQRIRRAAGERIGQEIRRSLERFANPA
jgi:F-type H+-transporting ATPase subunit delta